MKNFKKRKFYMNLMSENKIIVMDFNEKIYDEYQLTDLETFKELKEKPGDMIRWIHIVGINRYNLVNYIGSKYNFHPLIIDDLMEFNTRPKMDYYDNHLYLAISILNWKETEKIIESEQVNIVFSKEWIISFEESEKIVFLPLIERLRKGKDKVRSMSIEFLMYSLIDNIMDQYFEVLEKLSDTIEELENELIEKPLPSTIHSIHFMRREIMTFRKSVWPLREIIRKLERGEIKEISKSTTLVLYYRDLYDHSVQIIESLENIRDLLSGMIDIYLSSFANKQNEVMKVLTIISTIFIPLTFIAGVYGMNFKYMPEIDHPLGYLITWIVIIALAVFMLSIFVKKGWINFKVFGFKRKNKTD